MPLPSTPRPVCPGCGLRLTIAIRNKSIHTVECDECRQELPV